MIENELSNEGKFPFKYDYLVWCLMNQILILEAVLNEEKQTLETKVRSNWSKYISTEKYSLENIEKECKNNINSEIKNLKYDFLNNEGYLEIKNIKKEELYILSSYLRIMILINENKFEGNRSNDIKLKFDCILSECNLKNHLNILQLEKLGNIINLCYKKEFNYRIINELFKGRIDLIKQKLAEIETFIPTEKLKGSIEATIVAVEKVDNEKTVDDLLEHILESSKILKEKLKEQSKQGTESKNINSKYNELKNEYERVKYEKNILSMKIADYVKKLSEEGRKYYQLSKESKINEENAYLKGIRDMFKCLNDPENLFIDKINACIKEQEDLNLNDMKRLSTNLIYNLENLGILQNPEFDFNSKLTVSEKEIEIYRCNKALADEIIENKENQVKIKYPSWIYINTAFSNKKTVLLNPMITKGE
ncbi:MAG: hypothetical protein LLF98_11940 [Clostridium sp.]|uniref:hypothetical protein n=1 Tax=Clostridium sp. TaxID=1506 RepID=UPI0025B832FC|nr:hypothetical protein [Clostridium sp.]MCE5221940.1 hypothetical protein [Clostridium sp.]